MKRIIHYFCLATAFAGLVAGFSSCDVTNTHRGGRIDPEYPDDPTRPGEGTELPRDITFTDGYGEFYGPWYNDKTDNYLIFLYEGETDRDGNFTSSARKLTLDIILPKSDEITLKEGVYDCSDEDNTTFIFVPTYDSRDEQGNYMLDGSLLYVQSDPQHSQKLSITDGKLTVKKFVTGHVGIEGNIKAGGVDYSIHYKGSMEISDMRGGGGDVPYDVEMKNISRVVAVDCGQVWEGIECTDYRDWILYFYDKDAATTNEYACVEFLTKENVRGSLPEMKLDKVVQIGNPSEFVPGVIIAGYTDDDNYVWGTWYCKGGYGQYAASKGSLEIKPSGNGYSMAFDFVDEDETYGGSFKGSYTGQVEFTVDQGASQAPRKAAGRFFSPHRGTAVTRSARPSVRSHAHASVK